MGSVKDLEVRRKPTEIMMGDGVFHFSDRYSVFDWGEMPDHIVNKGASLCAISAYFYLRIVMYMYMKEPKTAVQLSASPGIALALAITVIAVLLIGVFPSKVISVARIAAGF